METLEFSLVDDGAMDTVVECYCTVCERTWEERFDSESAAEYRDWDGSMSDNGLADMLADFDVHCVDCAGKE